MADFTPAPEWLVERVRQAKRLISSSSDTIANAVWLEMFQRGLIVDQKRQDELVEELVLLRRLEAARCQSRSENPGIVMVVNEDRTIEGFIGEPEGRGAQFVSACCQERDCDDN